MGGRAQSCAGASCCRLQPWPLAAPQPGGVAVATLGVPRLLRVPQPAERCRSAPRPCSSTSSAPPPSGVSSARGSAPGCPSLRCPLWGEIPEPSLPGGGGGSGCRGAIAGWKVGVSVLGWGHPEPQPLAVVAPWPVMEERSRRGGLAGPLARGLWEMPILGLCLPCGCGRGLLSGAVMTKYRSRGP